MTSAKSKKKAELATNSSQASVSMMRTPKTLKPTAKQLKRSMKRKLRKSMLKSKKAEGSSQSQVTEDKNKKTATVGKQNNLNTNGNGEQRKISKTLDQNRVEAPNYEKKAEVTNDDNKNKTTTKLGKQCYLNTSGNENQKKIKNKMLDKNRGKAPNSERNAEGSSKNPVTDEDKKKNKNKKVDRNKVEAPNSERKVGGLIFMCSAKTKPECFHYKIMALPSSKKEVVLNIKPGLKLFLYDFDLRLLYGIFEASSCGGMKLEPSAFGGTFPAQVRFRIYEDCLPLPESAFKNAIKENYDEKTNKFKTELTNKQVKKLRSLFRPVRQPHLEHHPVTLQPASSSDLLFVTEKEYRSYGLRPELRGLRQDTVSYVPVSKANHGREQVFSSGPIYKDAPSSQDQILRNPTPSYRSTQEMFVNPAPTYGSFSLLHAPAVGPEPYFLSENEYRMYGLQGRNEHPTLISATTRPTNELNSYRDKQYQTHNYNITSSGPFSSLTTGAGTYDAYSQLTVTDSYRSDLGLVNHTADYHLPRRVADDGLANHTADYHLPRRVADDGLYSTYASRDLSAYKQRSHVDGQSELGSASVTTRYSFSGASYSLR